MKIGKTELKSITEDMNEKIIQCLKEHGTFFDSYKIDQEPRAETNDLLDSYFKYMNVNADHWHVPVESRVRMAADHMLAYFEGSEEERLLNREVLAYVIKARGFTVVDMKVEQAKRLAELLSKDSELFFMLFLKLCVSWTNRSNPYKIHGGSQARSFSGFDCKVWLVGSRFNQSYNESGI